MNVTREQFEKFKELPLFKGKIISDSMVPVINVNEDVVIDVGEKDLKRFDIIVIWVDGKLVCHYLWQMNKIVKPLLLQTRNMRGKLDYPVREEDYLGKVISHKIGFWRRLRILV